MGVSLWLVPVLATAISLSGATGASAAAPSAVPALAFTSATVLPMTRGEPVLRNQTVVVTGGIISAIGPARSVAIPKQAVRIDARGKYLLPGLADMHVHLEHFDHPDYLKLFLVHGVTFVRNMDGRPNILDWKRQGAAGSLDSPDIMTAGQVLDGAPPVRGDNVALASPSEGKSAVTAQADAGYDFIKVYTNLGRPTFEAIMQEAARRKLTVAGHVPKSVPFAAFLTSGVKSLEHLSDFGDLIAADPVQGQAPPPSLKRRLGFAADPRRIDAVVRQVAAAGIWVVPTMITDSRVVASPAEVREWERSPEMASVDRGIVRYWKGSLARAAGRLGPSDWRWLEQGRDNHRALALTLHRAGVPMLLGTDTPQPFVFPGASVHDELAIYVAAGLRPSEALALATREPARFAGQEKLWGTVERGKRANLLLLNANPIKDIHATRSIAGVAVGGRWFPKHRLDRMRKDVEKVAAASD